MDCKVITRQEDHLNAASHNQLLIQLDDYQVKMIDLVKAAKLGSNTVVKLSSKEHPISRNILIQTCKTLISSVEGHHGSDY